MFWPWFFLLILALAEGAYSLKRGWGLQDRWMRAAAGGKASGTRWRPAFFGLRSSDFELVFVVEDESDPAWERLNRLRRTHPGTPARVLVAGAATGCGQKVHNLRFAVEHLPERIRCLVLADSDIRPLPDWLEALTGALDLEQTGLASGFRWYLPRPGCSPATLLRSAWNAGILSLLGTQDSPFGWGGALACSRQVFEQSGGRRCWEGSLSDDYSLSAAVRARGYRIRFVPRALSLSPGSCSLRDLLRWSARQMSITRIYHPRLWNLAWVSQVLYGTSVWATVLLVCLPASLSGLNPGRRLFLAALALLVAGLSGVKARRRLLAVAALLPEKSDEILRCATAYGLAAPFCNLVTLQALARSLISRDIEWRGIRYRMVSPRETIVLSRSSPE